MKLAEDTITNLILEVANLKGEVTYSDLQGLALATAQDILRLFGKPSILRRNTDKSLIMEVIKNDK